MRWYVKEIEGEKMLEYAFEKKAVMKLRRLPTSYWPDKPPTSSLRGTADRTGCINGIMCALEFKRDSKEASKLKGRIVLQKHILNKIRDAGGYAAVVWPENWPLVYEEIKAFCGVEDV